MNFKRCHSPLLPVESYDANAGPYRFLILKDMGKFSVSYRLRDENIPKGVSVSASATIMGPFDEFSDATAAAEAKWAELKRLS